MSDKKFCVFCNKDISTSNFSEHKKTLKHKNNIKNYKKPNLLESKNEVKSNIAYIKLKLEDLKNEIDNILNNINV